MDELKVFELYNDSNDKKKKDFWKTADTSMELTHNYEKNIVDDKWITLMEDTIRYLDNILRNPNRFIMNEEEVVKIELARRITVDSIKHLSRNTNLIQEFDLETGDVMPSKILNINKEENYNTYENRFIYSLIRNMRTYIDMKKKKLNIGFKEKSDKLMNYQGKSKVGKENVSINVMYKSALDKNDSDDDNIEKRIAKLEMRVRDLMNTDLYKTIDKLRISLIMSPIKKTNLILKNTNFQFAVRLWNFLQENAEDETKIDSGNNVLNNDEELKKLMDETFMLNYLVVNSIEKDDDEEEKQKKISKVLINNLIQKLVLSSENMSKKELNQAISEQYKMIKNQTLADEKEIAKIFKMAINEYTKSIVNLKLRGKNAKNNK